MGKLLNKKAPTSSYAYQSQGNHTPCIGTDQIKKSCGGNLSVFASNPRSSRITRPGERALVEAWRVTTGGHPDGGCQFTPLNKNPSTGKVNCGVHTLGTIDGQHPPRLRVHGQRRSFDTEATGQGVSASAARWGAAVLSRNGPAPSAHRAARRGPRQSRRLHTLDFRRRKAWN
jgi:hypothetical protein